jgi:hypothetical protein
MADPQAVIRGFDGADRLAEVRRIGLGGGAREALARRRLSLTMPGIDRNDMLAAFQRREVRD